MSAAISSGRVAFVIHTQVRLLGPTTATYASGCGPQKVPSRGDGVLKLGPTTRMFASCCRLRVEGTAYVHERSQLKSRHKLHTCGLGSIGGRTFNPVSGTSPQCEAQSTTAMKRFQCLSRYPLDGLYNGCRPEWCVPRFLITWPDCKVLN